MGAIDHACAGFTQSRCTVYCHPREHKKHETPNPKQAPYTAFFACSQCLFQCADNRWIISINGVGKEQVGGSIPV
jgi:hypothetical protein